jgi:hypothetical protein
MGSAVALLKTLLVGGGAKIAATVATVAATSIVAATPAARHDLVKLVAADPRPPVRMKPAVKAKPLRKVAVVPVHIVHVVTAPRAVVVAPTQRVVPVHVRVERTLPAQPKKAHHHHARVAPHALHAPRVNVEHVWHVSPPPSRPVVEAAPVPTVAPPAQPKVEKPAPKHEHEAKAVAAAPSAPVEAAPPVVHDPKPKADQKPDHATKANDTATATAPVNTPIDNQPAPKPAKHDHGPKASADPPASGAAAPVDPTKPTDPQQAQSDPQQTQTNPQSASKTHGHDAPTQPPQPATAVAPPSDSGPAANPAQPQDEHGKSGH